MDVGMIGLGMMGRAMAQNIAAAGHRVSAWNRSPLANPPAGVAMVATIDEAVAAPVLVSMLADDAAMRATLIDGGALAAMRPGTLHIVAATISVAFADELAAAHEAAGLRYVAAPVFGRPAVAAAGQLTVVAAGEADAIAAAAPVFDAIGRRTVVLGATPSQANAAKVAGNMMLAMAIEAMAEAVALTEGHDIARATFLDLMLESLFACRAYQGYGGNIVREAYDPGFKMALGLKDLRLATAAADQGGAAPLPMLDAVRTRMAAAVEAGLGDRDWSAIADYRAKPALA